MGILLEEETGNENTKKLIKDEIEIAKKQNIEKQLENENIKTVPGVKEGENFKD